MKHQEMEKKKLGWKHENQERKVSWKTSKNKDAADRSSSLFSFYTFRHFFGLCKTLSKKKKTKLNGFNLYSTAGH